MKKIILLIAILIGGAGAFGFYYYNKHRSGVTGLTPVTITDAKALYDEYSADETTSNTKFLGKVVQVSGVVKSVETDERGTMSVILNSGNDMGSVNCQFEKQDQMPVLNNGSTVMIKGFCSGILMDVVLVDCEMVKENK